MYVAGFVIPVPADKMEAYRKWAETSAAFFKDYGCLEIVESWEDKVPRGSSPTFIARWPRAKTRGSSSPGRSGPAANS